MTDRIRGRRPGPTSASSSPGPVAVVSDDVKRLYEAAGLPPSAFNTRRTFLGRDIRGWPIYRVEGRSGSRGVIVRTGAWDGKTFHPPRWPGRSSRSVSETPIVGGPAAGPAAPSADVKLEKQREDLIAWIWSLGAPGGDTVYISESELSAWTKEAAAAETGVQLFNLQSRINNIVQKRLPVEAIWGPPLEVGGGGGGGGGASSSVGPVYRAPDRRVVEDYVSGLLVNLVGHIPEREVARLADIYMRDHRRNWQSTAAEIDPQASVVEAIRGTGYYQNIHKLRPDSEDERTWVASRRAAAAAGGLNVERREEFSIMQAAVGGDVEDVRDAAGLEQLQISGRPPDLILSQMRNVARGLFAEVRR